MTPLQPGECLHRIAFDEPVTTRNGTGEYVDDFVEAFQRWGTVSPLTGSERFRAGQVIAEGMTRIRVYWDRQTDRINSKWRARHQGIVYNIDGQPAQINMGRREIEIMGVSGANLG